MPTTCPANIEEFLTFLPKRPKLHPDAKNKTSTADYSARDILPPEYRYISCQPYPDLVPNLKNFIGGVVNDLRIGSVSCQPRQDALDSMAMSSFRAEGDVSQYGSDVTTAVRPVVAAIATAARFAGPIYVLHDSVEETVYAQRGGFNITVVRRRTETEDSRTKSVPIQVCSDADKAYSVLLSKAKALSGSFSLDAAQKQTGAKAMVVKLALQMVTAKAEYGFFFGGFLAIAAQLVHSTDPSRPGMMLLLSPAFKLQKETLPVPNTRKQLTPFQAGIQPSRSLPYLSLCYVPS
ncbi:hypothetical protein BDZ97DRAFT_1019956 [Flammula alnicola]|nr:hypothetical protein BDZ97DRAFT_1019956 [Flammula alnicola]